MPKAEFKMDMETARWVAYLSEKIASECFFMSVAGVSFPNDDGSSRQAIIANCKVRDWLELEHQPDNRHHKHAVKVLTQNRQQLGYLERIWGDLICKGASSGGRYTAVIALVERWPNRKILGVHIAVFRLSPQFLSANPSEGQAVLQGLIAPLTPEPQTVSQPTAKQITERQRAVFESWLNRTQINADVTIYAKLRGVQHDNADGISRQELLLGLVLHTELDVGVNDELTRVQIYTKEGEELGYLDTLTSRKVLESVIDGKIWKAYSGPVGDVPSGKWKTVTVGLVRVPEAVAIQGDALDLVAAEENTTTLLAKQSSPEQSKENVVVPISAVLKPTRYAHPVPDPPTFMPPERRKSQGTRWERTTEGKALLLALCVAYIIIRLMISCN